MDGSRLFPFFLEPIAISVSSIFPNCPISHLPACAACPAWPMQTRCPIYNLPPSPLPPSIPHFLTNLHFNPFRFTSSSSPQKRTVNRVHAICLSISYRPIVDPLSFLSLDPNKTTRTRLGKKHGSSRGLSLSLPLSVRPFVRVKDSFLSYPFHS